MLNLSNSPEDLFKVVRDRYRLAKRVELKFPPPNICYACKQIVEQDSTVRVMCCKRSFHGRCIKSERKCPYCREPWVALPCCFCHKTFNLTGCHYESYSTLVRNRMTCCKADIHEHCRQFVIAQCQNCQSSGVPANDPSTFCHTRR